MKKLKYISAVLSIFTALNIICQVQCFAIAAAYDAREEKIVTPVSDQGDTTLCWAYASVSAAEASLLKSNLAEEESLLKTFLSPTQIGYACNTRGADPLNNTSGYSSGKDYRYTEGNSSYVPALLSQWCGPVGKGLADNCNGWENAQYIMVESAAIDGEKLSESEEARLKVKEAILKYGAVTFSYNNARETYYYNPLNETGSKSYPHACTIIGWDDNISADKFLPGGASQNGGWLVKNSYSSLPYFYLSYDNTSSNIYGFAFSEKDRYDRNYFYDSDTADFGLGSLLKPKCTANIFSSKGGEKGQKEYVAAVNAGIVGKNTEIRVSVYKNLSDNKNPESGTLAAEEEFYAEHSGYYTIELSSPVLIEKGESFSVVAQIVKGDSYIKLTQNSGKSFIRRNNSWNESAAPRIKAYTKVVSETVEIFDRTVWVSPENEGGEFVLAAYIGNYLKDLRVYSIGNGKGRRFEIPKEWEKGVQIKGLFWRSFENITPIYKDEKSRK